MSSLPEMEEKKLRKAATIAFVERLFSGAGVLFFTSLLVFAGVSFAIGFISRSHPNSPRHAGRDYLDACAEGDGTWYTQIVKEGYIYDPKMMSNSAFFPAYPALAAALKYGLGLRTEVALLIVSNGCFLLAIWLLREYVLLRYPQSGEAVHELIISACCLYPVTFFFRMTYTESLFMLCCVALMYGMEKKWHWSRLALIAGLATATRSVGVALAIPVAMQLWQERASVKGFVAKGLIAGPLCFWGLLGFILFQWIYLDEPWAFLEAQKFWVFAEVPPFGQKCWDLLRLKPIWGVYTPGMQGMYWGYSSPSGFAEMNLMFWNPIYWVFAMVCVLVGYWKKLLTGKELALSLALLLIPYYLQGPRAGMMSCARYSAVVFPIYVVLGHWLNGLPRWCQHVWFGVCAVGMFLGAAMFCRGYSYY